MTAPHTTPHDTAARPRRGRILALLGPGLLVAATGVGAGDLITSGLAGSALGLAILWVPLAGALLKFALNEGLARWQLATGTTLLEGWTLHLGRPLRWIFGSYLVLWSFITAGAMANACGVAGTALLPLGEPATSRALWGAAHALVGLWIVRRGGFRLFETAMSIGVAVMFVLVFATAALVAPELSSLPAGALDQGLPAGGEGWLLGVLGGVGGTVTLLSYGYWIAEHDRRGAAGLATCRVDLGICYLLTGLFGAAMILIGSRTQLDGSGAGVGVELAAQLGTRFGPVGEQLFLLGFWGAVFSSLLGVWQGVPYLFADFLALGRNGSATAARTQGAASPPPRVSTDAPAYRRFQIALAVLPLVLLLEFDVRTIQLAYAVLGALFMPLLALTLLMLNNRARLIGARFANGLLTNAALLATLVVFALIGARKLADMFGA